MRKSRHKPDEEIGEVLLGFSEDEATLAMGSPNAATSTLPLVFYTSNVGKVRDVLGFRACPSARFLKDAPGTHYFEMVDLEGNKIEFSEEP